MSSSSSGARKGTRSWFARIRDEEKLTKRYRELVKLHHPDITGSDGHAMAEINAEYKARMDELRDRRTREAAPPPPVTAIVVREEPLREKAPPPAAPEVVPELVSALAQAGTILIEAAAKDLARRFRDAITRRR